MITTTIAISQDSLVDLQEKDTFINSHSSKNDMRIRRTFKKSLFYVTLVGQVFPFHIGEDSASLAVKIFLLTRHNHSC